MERSERTEGDLQDKIQELEELKALLNKTSCINVNLTDSMGCGPNWRGRIRIGDIRDLLVNPLVANCILEGSHVGLATCIFPICWDYLFGISVLENCVQDNKKCSPNDVVLDAILLFVVGGKRNLYDEIWQEATKKKYSKETGI